VHEKCTLWVAKRGVTGENKSFPYLLMTSLKRRFLSQRFNTVSEHDVQNSRCFLFYFYEAVFTHKCKAM